MDIKQIKISDLKKYANNPRKNASAVDAVANSIREFGFKSPIIIDKDNVIIAGHTRLAAAKKLGMKEVPCIMADDLTPEQVNAYRLADNKTAELAEWDFSLLDDELEKILNIDMSEFGFELGDEPETQEAQEDDYKPELPAEPKAKLGDIYQLGRHRLMCGDAMVEADVEALIDSEHIELALTDPPYGIDVVQGNSIGGGVTHFGKVGGGNIVKSSTYMKIKGDDTTDTARVNYDILKKLTDNQIIFGGNYFTEFLPSSRCWLVWDKQNTGNFVDAELAWTSFNKGVKLYHFMWNGLAREGSRAVEGAHRVHPTQKPVGLFSNILNDFSKDGDSILDCFGGSGSVLIACEQIGRKCYMMEYEPNYIDVIIDRWQKLTGETAVLLSGE